MECKPMMEYIGNRTFTESSEVAGFWVKGKKVLDVSTSTHIKYMLDHAEEFGLSDLEIRQEYKKNKEPYGFEGKARKSLILRVSQQGWMRVRHYTRPRDYWSVQVDSTRARKEDIQNFLFWAIEHNLMRMHDPVTLMGYNEPMDQVEYGFSDGGVAKYLEESKENKCQSEC